LRAGASSQAGVHTGPVGHEGACRFFAVCPKGLEEALAAELRACGALGLDPTSGGVAFEGSLHIAYAANLHSRIASRVLWRVGGGACRSEDELFALAHAVAWEDHFSPKQTVRANLTATRSPLRSLQFATLRIKDAIADRMRAKVGARPSVDRKQPDVQVMAHLDAARADLYLDLSGSPLFKRGWRQEKGEAPLKENLAAGLLALAGWSAGTPLHDPFCGSGTILIEAASIATGRAPGLGRRFAFEKLMGFEQGRWRDLLQSAREAIDDRADFHICGRDISSQVVRIARSNASRGGLDSALRRSSLCLEVGDARAAPAPFESGLIVTNPPYGQQSEPRSASVARLMARFGDQLKRAYAGWNVWMLSGDLDLPSQLKLRESRRTVLFNGPIECRYFRFDVVAGSYRRDRAPRSEP
jgi:putative N6-adenine-specific DNA methylase